MRKDDEIGKVTVKQMRLSKKGRSSLEKLRCKRDGKTSTNEVAKE